MSQKYQDGPVDEAVILSILDAVPLGVILISAAGEILYTNSRAEQILQKQTSECEVIALRLSKGETSSLELDLQIGADEDVTARLQEVQTACSQQLQSGERAIIFCRQEYVPSPEDLLLEDWRLTQTEAQVSSLVARGLSVDEIARELGVATATARTHLRNIFNKTGTNRQSDLIRLVMRRTNSLRNICD